MLKVMRLKQDRPIGGARLTNHDHCAPPWLAKGIWRQLEFAGRLSIARFARIHGEVQWACAHSWQAIAILAGRALQPDAQFPPDPFHWRKLSVWLQRATRK